jgi:hypothetical protein
MRDQMAYIVLRAKNLDQLLQSAYCEYFGPFADADAAQEFAKIENNWVSGVTADGYYAEIKVLKS